MGTFHTYANHAKDMTEADISIVDALTGPELCYVEMLVEIDMSRIEHELKIYGDFKEDAIKSGRVKSKPLAINYATSDMPPTIIDPENDTAYRIYSVNDGATKIICSHESKLNCFRDAIKPSSHNHYVWEGTVNEIIEEFKDAGFELKEKVSIGEIQAFQKIYEESMEMQQDL